jgi:rhodanese-related sulfurtransferase
MKLPFNRGPRLFRGLTATALVLGAFAAFAGSPVATSNARIDVAILARTVDREDDHVTSVELARWIKDKKENLRIIDIRDSVDFADYHIPGAERIDLTDLVKTPFRKNETIVLYSGGGAHAAQGWVFLRALGYTQVYFLRGGLAEWLDDVMNPTISSNASDSARGEFTKTAEISRYFGGVPRVGESSSAAPVVPHSSSETPKAVDKVARIRGRGC